MKYEELLEHVGSYGPYQKKLVCLMMFAVFPNVFGNIAMVYLHYSPDFICNGDSSANLMENYTDGSRNISRTGDFQADKCKIISGPNITDFESGNNLTMQILSCNGYIYDKKPGESSAVTEFNMVCENAWEVPFAVSIYMAGKAVGSFFGKLSDRYGRRPVFLLATLVQHSCFGIAGYSWNYESYVICILLIGLSSYINYVSSLVLTSEMVSRKHRNKTLILNFLACAVSYVIVPILAYFVRDWRWLLRTVCLSVILYIPYYWLIPESARWLIKADKTEEAKKVLYKMAKANGKVVNLEELFEEKMDLTEEIDAPEKDTEVDVAKESSLLFVFRQSELRPRFITTYLSWFICSMVYYAIALNPTQLSGDRFLNVALMGLMEIPAYGLCYLVEWLGRPRAAFLVMIFTGIFCAISPFLTALRSEIVTAVVTISKSCVTTAYGIVYIILLEISPTLVRNNSMSVGSFLAKVGGFVSPYIMFAGQVENLNRNIPYVIMALMCIAISFLFLFFLPETRAIPMPDTVQEACSNIRYYRMKVCQKFEEKRESPQMI